jgi:hypothetical protein
MLSDTGPNSLIQAQSIPHQTHTAIVALSAQHNPASSALSLRNQSPHVCAPNDKVSFSHAYRNHTKDVLSQMLRTAIRYSQHKSPLVSAITAKTTENRSSFPGKNNQQQKTTTATQKHTLSGAENPLFHNRRSPHNKSHISAGFRQCSHHASHNHLSSQQQSPASQRQSTLESAAIPNLVFPILAVSSQQTTQESHLTLTHTNSFHSAPHTYAHHCQTREPS